MSASSAPARATITLTFEGRAIRIVDQAGIRQVALADACAVLDIPLATADRVLIGPPTKRASRRPPPPVTPELSNDRRRAPASVDEVGLYRLANFSRAAGAQRFLHWLTHDALPAARAIKGAPSP